jgi:molybdate transport system ATP-binding protein
MSVSEELQAKFELRYRSGFKLQFALQMPADYFSLTVLFGPSGCGKTSVLRCLAGLQHPEVGFIRWKEETWFDFHQRRMTSPQQRNIGFLFQDYALFPHLTVEQNIAFSLRNQSADSRKQMVAEFMERFQIQDLQHRLPQQISGGQQQRVALARALASRPRLLLLDEPLSALDESMRSELRYQLRSLLADFGIPVILVTHDRLEAMALADQMIVLDHGQILQTGTVQDLFQTPRTAAVARIVGVENILAGTVTECTDEVATVLLEDHPLQIKTTGSQVSIGQRVQFCIRGEEILLQNNDSDCANRLSARVVSLTPEGPLTRIGLDCGFRLSALVSHSLVNALQLQSGKETSLHLPASQLRFLK